MTCSNQLCGKEIKSPSSKQGGSIYWHFDIATGIILPYCCVPCIQTAKDKPLDKPRIL